jgi:hypothetical protein
MPLPKINREHPSFPEPADDSILVWRYLDLPGLLSIVLQSQLPLIRLSELPDKFEGTLGAKFEVYARQALIRTHLQANLPVPPQGLEKWASENVQQFKDLYKNPRQRAYVSSWRMGPGESEAMWRIYGQGDGSVALVTTYARLRDSLPEVNHLYIGKVFYADLVRHPVQIGNTFLPLMHKRQEFDHEKEVRIVQCNLEVPDRELAQLPRIHPIPWEPANWVDKIILSPYAPQWKSHIVRETLQRLNPQLADRVVDSEMTLLPE